jgi:aspartyl-tRNA(Asn)/glutamyl-tRNA(Gln) amidotransferase subunit A
MTLQQKIKQIKQGKLTAEANIKQFLNKIKSDNPNINAILHTNPNALQQAKEIDKKIKQKKAGKLAGLGVIIKSNINVKNLITNCASKTLENYKAPYNATAINKLLQEDAIILGMANMDEFASGASGETSAFKPTKNPKALDRIPGGSSSGSAASVSADFCDFSLGSDTGGSIRNPASHCGVVGFKPTYGTVSRYGLIDLSMSLDIIGPITKTTEDAELIYNIIKGKDKHDSSSIEYNNNNNNNNKEKSLNEIKIGILNIKADPKLQELINSKVKEVSNKNNYKIKKIDLNHADLGIQTYYPIVYTEFFSGTRKFDGRKYGKKIEDSCGEEVLRRILGGKEITKAEFAGKYYRRALNAKKIIEQEFQDAFKKVDIIITPTVPKLPHKLKEKISIEDSYNYDTLTALANITQIPAISIPAGTIEDNNQQIPVGIQLMAKKGDDNFLLQIAKKFEE